MTQKNLPLLICLLFIDALLCFFFFFFVCQDYYIDAPIEVGDGFSFSGGAYYLLILFPNPNISLFF